MKKSKKIISICLSLLLTLQLIPSVFGLSLEHTNSEDETVKLTDFLDTKGHWAHNQIYQFAEYGLVAGNNGYFMPNSPIKRGDLAIIIDRMLGLKTITYNFYNDLPNDAYYRDAVLRCVAAGYIAGTSVNTISPDGFATREQVAVIITRMLNLDTGYSGNTGFKDDSSISSWAKSSVYAMKKLGYMNGNDAGNVMPQSYITRAELVTILNNIAHTYIPKSDKSGQGNVFTGQYPTNIITSRNIELSNATVGRDIILTKSVSSFNANNVNVLGRLYVMTRSTINLSNTKVSQIYLVDGKSTVSGISSGVSEVYVASYATESTLDSIPNRLVLESGVRVKIDGVMYENDTNKIKTYYGIDIKADIADEQNYVVGGPRITGTKFTQEPDNTITVSNVIVNKNDTEIEEIGVVWLDQELYSDIKNPSYQNYDGKKVYETNKFNEPISFTVDNIDGMRAYRVYVKDSDGLFAYSNTTVFTEYSYSISLNIYDNSYPEKVDVEVVFKGEQIPNLSTVRVVYGYSGIYNEKLNEISLRLYSDSDAENQPDTTKYKRYIGTIICDTEQVDGEKVYIPPTHYGYIINYRDGTIMNKYPILSNALPEGVSPMSELRAGIANYSGDNINIMNSYIKTRYVIPQEVGIVYRYSDLESISSPMISSVGWNYSSSGINVGLGESAYYNNTILGDDDTKYTYYAAYTKTSNGYWYSDVKRVINNVVGDIGGPVIQGVSEVNTLNNSTAVVVLKILNMETELDVNSNIVYLSSGDSIFKSLNDLDYSIERVSETYSNLYLKIDNLDELSDSNNFSICLKDINGLKSNLYSIQIDKDDIMPIVFSNKGSVTVGRTRYNLMIPNSNIQISQYGHNLNGESSFDIIGIYDTIYKTNSIDINTSKIDNLSIFSLYLKYKCGSTNKYYSFVREFNGSVLK